MKIEPGKKYQTANGMPAVVYALYDNNGHGQAVHGAYQQAGGQWVPYAWGSGGHAPFGQFDLVEVKPRIKRTVWLNVYPYEAMAHPSRESANSAGAGNRDRIACIKVEIDCEEGEGLS